MHHIDSSFQLLIYTVANLASDSRAKVTVVISHTEEGPKYWIAPGNKYLSFIAQSSLFASSFLNTGPSSSTRAFLEKVRAGCPITSCIYLSVKMIICFSFALLTWCVSLFLRSQRSE